jgi:hypothetical protein
MGRTGENRRCNHRFSRQDAVNSGEGRQVPVRYIGEQQVGEDLGRLPSFRDWIAELPVQPWMYGQKLVVANSP